jgi:chorismate mutase
MTDPTDLRRRAIDAKDAEIMHLRDERAALRKRVAELEGALRPFAKYETRVQFKGTATSNIPMVKDIERARAALAARKRMAERKE